MYPSLRYSDPLFLKIRYLLIATVGLFAGCGDSSVSDSISNLTPYGPRSLEGRRWQVVVSSDGSWGKSLTNLWPGFGSASQFPKNSGNSVFFSGGFYISGISNGKVRVSTVEHTSEFRGGTVANHSTAPDSQLRVGQDSMPVYIIEKGVLSVDYEEWPTKLGAPVDVQGHPLQISDVDSWTIFHDLYADSLDLYSDSGNLPMGLEVQRMTYMFNSADYLANTYFIRLQIKNKSKSDYSNSFFSLWIDEDLGDLSDDRRGTDSSRNMIYVYNTGIDSNSGGTQYSAGYTMLYCTKSGGANPKLYSTNFFYKTTYRRLDQTKLNLIEGLSIEGNTSLGSSPDSPRLVWTGDPITNTGFVEDTTPVGDGYILLSTGPFDFNSNESYDIVFAVVVGEASTRNGAIIDLRLKVDQVHTYFTTVMLSQLNLPQ